MLVDTSVWVDYLRRGNERLAARLIDGSILCHPFVIGELACGNLRNRQEFLSLLGVLPQAPVADQEDVLAFVERNKLMGKGIGWIDMHLLVSTILANTGLWTLDLRLAQIARALGFSV